MTRDEMMSLILGERVIVKASGKIYMVTIASHTYTADDVEKMRRWRSTIREGYRSEPLFVQIRDGKRYGPERNLKPGNIALAGSA